MTEYLAGNISASPLATLIVAIVTTLVCPMYVYGSAKKTPKVKSAFQEAFWFIFGFCSCALSNIFSLPDAFPLPAIAEISWLAVFIGVNVCAYKWGQKHYKSHELG